MIARILVALVAYSLSTGGPLAQSDLQTAPGVVERYDHDILDAARAPPITTFGEDVLRFSSQPALGGVGYVIVLRSNGHVRVSWFYGHGARGWRRTRWVAFRVAEREYQNLMQEIDPLLDAAAPDLREMDEMDLIGVCADGAGYLTERVRNGEANWYRPDCGRVNEEIAAILALWVFRRIDN